MVSENENTTALEEIKANAEVISFYFEALKLQEYATTRVIINTDDLELANDDLSIISKVRKALKEKREEYVRPLQTRLEEVRDAFKTLMEPIEEANRITKDKMLAFDAEQKRIRQEQERINQMRIEAARAEQELKGEITGPVNLVEVMPEAPTTIRTDVGTSGIVTIWKFEVINFSLLPDRFKIENATLIGKVVRAGEREIPGVKIWSEDTLRSTPR